MSHPSPRHLCRMERRFSITVRGELGARFGDVFGPVETTRRGDETVVEGRYVDQANLDGILAYFRALAIELKSVQTWMDAPEQDAAGREPESKSEV